MPVYVKEGSILPFGPELQYTDEKPADTIALYVYAGKNAAFQLYEDGGTTYDYEKGLYSVIPLSWDEATQSLTIGARKGSFPGMLSKRVFRIIPVRSGRPVALELEKGGGKEVAYEGKKVVVKL